MTRQNEKGVVATVWAVLFEWGDFAERFRTLGAIPRRHEFVLVEGCPLLYEAARSLGKPSLGHDSEVYIYRGFMFTVSGVEMGWRMVWDMNAEMMP